MGKLLFGIHSSLRNLLGICLGLLVGLVLLSTSAMAGESPTVKDWNFLVFINGKNNLDQFGAMNINQMEEIGSSDKLNIIVEWGSLRRPSVDRLLIKKDSNTTNVTSPVVQSLGGKVDMGDYRSVVDFVKWAQATYPAKQTFLVIWDHGGGWHVLNNSQLQMNDISWDDRTGNVIKTEQLGPMTAEIEAILGHKLDILGTDACLMGMAEVADEIADHVSFFVGSQEVEPGDGWPYADFLRIWSANISSFDAAAVAKQLSRDYVEAYSGGVYGNQDVTMSAFDLSHQPHLRSSVKALATELLSLPAGQFATIRDAAMQSKAFYYSDYKDFVDFLDLGGQKGVNLTTAAAARLAYKNFVIANDQNTASTVHGLSIWLPTDKSSAMYMTRYLGLSFAKATGWGEVAKKILGN